MRFTWKADGKPSLGVIAQEVEKVYPELVLTAPDGMKSVDDDELVAMLIESSKTLLLDRSPNGGADIADAHVARCARRLREVVRTSDPGDLRAIDPKLTIPRV